MTTTDTSLFRVTAAALKPGTVVVRRGSNSVQVGLVPGRAVAVTPPPGYSPRRLVALLSALVPGSQLATTAKSFGLPKAQLPQLEDIMRSLADFGYATISQSTESGIALVPPRASGPRIPPIRRVHIIGSGQIAHFLRAPLQVNGCRLSTSAPAGFNLDPMRPPWNRDGGRPDLVIITDCVVPDPIVTSALLQSVQPHMHVFARDNRVVVGPTVLPGITPCLRCTDMYRAEHDPDWPMVAAQLMGQVGWAPAPSLTAAAALILAEVSASRLPDAPLQTLGASVEICPAEGVWLRRDWPAHGRCSCGAAEAPAALP